MRENDMGERGSRSAIDESPAKSAKISNPRETNSSRGSLGRSSERASGKRERNWRKTRLQTEAVVGTTLMYP